MHAAASTHTCPPIHIKPPSKNERLIEAMAADLIKYDAWRNEGDAIRSLMNREKYRPFDVFVCVVEAMHLAGCEVIAKEMSDQ